MFIKPENQQIVEVSGLITLHNHSIIIILIAMNSHHLKIYSLYETQKTLKTQGLNIFHAFNLVYIVKCISLYIVKITLLKSKILWKKLRMVGIDNNIVYRYIVKWHWSVRYKGFLQKFAKFSITIKRKLFDSARLDSSRKSSSFWSKNDQNLGKYIMYHTHSEWKKAFSIISKHQNGDLFIPFPSKPNHEHFYPQKRS